MVRAVVATVEDSVTGIGEDDTDDDIMVEDAGSSVTFSIVTLVVLFVVVLFVAVLAIVDSVVGCALDLTVDVEICLVVFLVGFWVDFSCFMIFALVAVVVVVVFLVVCPIPKRASLFTNWICWTGFSCLATTLTAGARMPVQ